jgi:enamine deaminase RidA (YjgF/YER057c/UK114 family)
VTVERIWPETVYVRRLNNLEGNVYAQTVTSTGSRHIHVAGTLPFDREQQLVGEGDVGAQTRCVLENIRLSLAAARATPQDVVRSKTYVVDMKDYLANGIPEWVKFFEGEPPTSTTVGVTELADPRALVEIEVYADLD